jgi:DNA (cytosine-5)-methyltransferase 1
MMQAIDFFCGGGGMTYGFRQAGINVIAGIDIDPKCGPTYEANNTPAKFINADIRKLTVDSVTKQTGIKKNDDNLIFIGCSPCQYWSIIKTDKTKSQDSKNLLADFQRFIEYFRPGFIVVENVPGIITRPGSPLNEFKKFLESIEYFSIEHRIIKVSEYGVPQSRKRFVLIASRTKTISFPEPVEDQSLTVRKFIGDKNVFPEIEAGHRDNTDFCHTASGIRDVSLRRLEMTPPDGGSRHAWKDTDLQIAVYKKNDIDKSFGFRDVYGRMYWDRLAPTITTKFFGISHGRFGHPEQNRAISIREGATLQTFPNEYIFKPEAISDKARLIGNAVPPELAKRVANSILS